MKLGKTRAVVLSPANLGYHRTSRDKGGIGHAPHLALSINMNDRKKHRLFELRYTNVDYGVDPATIFELRPCYSLREECVSTNHSGMHHQTLLLVCNTSFPQRIAWLPTIYSCGAYPLAFKEITYVSRNHM